MKTPRYSHTATLRPDGDVLFAGGASNDGVALSDREIFSATARRFNRHQALAIQPEADAPRLEAALPADGAMDVPLDALLAVRFSTLLRVDSIHAGSVTLTGPTGTVAVKVVPAEAGMLAFVTPKELLLPGASYTLSLMGLSDTAARLLPFASVTFTTGQTLAAPAANDNEEWTPTPENVAGNWQTGRAQSPWQGLAALQAAPGVTAVAGQALTLNGQPLKHVTLKVNDRTAQTDGTGRFLLTEVAAGHQVLVIDGRSASTRKKQYGVFEAGIDIRAGQTTALQYTIWMVKLDTAHAVEVSFPTTKYTVIKTPQIPGLELHLPEHTSIVDHEGRAVTRISITPIPLDRPPFPLPQDVYVPIYFTIQPGGAIVSVADEDGDEETGYGARLYYPNYRREAVGRRFDFWHYDPMGKGWYVYGQGSVSGDERQIVPDAGIAIQHFTGAMVALPNTAPAQGPTPCGAKDGDPIDLGTGLFVLSQTDLALPDVIPLAVTRTYRPQDAISRSFGIGTTHAFEMFLVGDTNPWTYIELILPDGGRIHYDRISAGTDFGNAVYEYTSTPTMFYKSRITWDSAVKWNLTLKDGTVYSFRAGDGATVAREAGLLSVQDRNGNRLTVERDSNSKITRLLSPNGRWIDLSYDTSNRVTQATDNSGRTVSYTYDTSGRLWKVTDVAGGVTEYTYDSSHRMLTIKDARGIVYLTNEYDANGRVSKQTQADSTVYQFAYTLNSNGKVTQTEVTDPRGNTRTVTFNGDGYTLTDTRGCCGGQAHTFARQTGTNFVLSVTDPLNRQTSYAYDAMGNVTSVTKMSGTSEAVTASFTYEATFNQVASVTDPLNHTSTFGYNGKGNLNSVTDALNHQTTMAYNPSGQPVSVTDALGNTAQFSYEGGDLVGVTNPLGQSGSRFVDGGGRLLRVANALGQRARYEYDVLNRPTQVTDPLQGVTGFSFDANGNLLSVTDARNSVTSYSYDNMDRVATRTDPLLRQESYGYDANGNLQQVTDRKSQVTSYTYDTLDRLTLVTYQDNSTTSYSYDSVNRLTQVVDSLAGTLSYTYDNLDRVMSEATAQGTVSYTYDVAGRRTSMTVPGQSVVNYSYDNANRLTQIQQGAATVTMAYDAANRRTSLTLPNGVVTEYSYDAASRLTGLTYKKSGNVLGNLTYEYDVAGRRTKMGGSFARTNLPSSLNATSYNAANHQTSFGSQTLTYDLNGNLTSDGVNSYTWNARNQLVSISGTGLSASFAYDANGRRSSKTINGTTTGYVYDGANVVQEQVGGAASANMLLGGVDEVFSRTEAAGTASPLRDSLGSTVSLTDASGVVQTEYSYEPFGKTAASGATSSNTQKYTGREDDGTGLYYYRARYYSSALQRFLSEDPIGFRGGMNLYAYVHNNPISFKDPYGLQEGGFWALDDPYETIPMPPSFGGRACDKRPTNIARMPDYYTFNANVGGTVGWATQMIVDRYGNVYGAPGPGYVGKSGGTMGKLGLGCSVTAGWLLRSDTPSPQELKDFLLKHSFSIGGGYILGCNLVYSPGSGWAVEFGGFSPQVSLTWQYDIESPMNKP